jgi:murein L,D-transpeptidase YafK
MIKFIFLLTFFILPLSILAAKDTVDLIIVYKEKRNMELQKNGKITNIYNISLGFEPVGAKIKRGDGKTPEGLYFIEDKLRESSFYMALKVSYPNPWDIRRALELNYHPGGQIMIHGVPNIGYDKNYHNFNNDWTEGCIAVSNKEILELWKKIEIGTPILIKK